MATYFWGNVSKRPTKFFAVYLLIWSQNFGKPEICDFDLENLITGILDDQQIIRLDVSVHNSTFVQVVYHLQQLFHY